MAMLRTSLECYLTLNAQHLHAVRSLGGQAMQHRPRMSTEKHE